MALIYFSLIGPHSGERVNLDVKRYLATDCSKRRRCSKLFFNFGQHSHLSSYKIVLEKKSQVLVPCESPIFAK